jgi:hypothetical protein
MGVEAFNFKQDILLPIITKPLPLETLKGVLHPFFKLPQAQLWSPLSVLQEQNIREERGETVEDIFLELDDEFVDSAEHRLLKEHFTSYLEVLLDLLDDGFSTTTNAFIQRLHDTKQVGTQDVFFADLYLEKQLVTF